MSWSLRRQVNRRSSHGLAAALALCLAVVAQTAARAAVPALEPVGQWGGQARGVAVSGSTAFVGIGPSVHVLDVSTPALPALIGQVKLRASVTSLALQGTYLYAVVGAGGLQIIDVSVPSAPVAAGYLDVAATANAVAVSGDYVYVAAHGQGLVIVNVADKGAPALAGSYDTPGYAYGVTGSGNLAYVADQTTLQIIDVSDKSAPALTWGGALTINQYMGVAVSGSVAYIAAGGYGLATFDVADPANPAFLTFAGHYEGGYQWYANTLLLSGTRAYVGMYALLMGGQAAVFDIADPAAPSFLGSAGTGTDNYTPGGVVSVALAGSSYFAVDPFNGLHVYDASTPAAMTRTAWYYTANSVNDVVASGTRAYLATANAVIPAFEFDGGTPLLRGKAQTPADHDIFFVQVDGTRLYASERTSGLGVYDLSDPVNPTRSGGAAVGDNTPMGLAVREGRAFVGTYYHGLEVFDVSAPAAPARIADIMGYDRAEDVVLQGNYAYVPGGSVGLHVVDVSDPAAPFVATTLNLGGWAYGLAVSGNRVYVGINSKKLVVVDITTPTAPWVAGSADVASSSTKDVLVVNDRYVLVAGWQDGVVLVDVGDPSAPTKVAAYDTPGSATNLARLGDLVLVADGEGGLAVFSLTIPADAQAVADTATTREGHGVAIDVLANDTGEGALTVTGVDDPDNGTATTDGSTVSYTPDAGWSGTEEFSYTMEDSIGGTASATVTVTVTPTPRLTVTSSGALDGWVLESAEASGKGGELNAGATTIRIGDDAADRQYRGILSFNTAGLPDDAVVTAATLKVRKQSIVGKSPFWTHGMVILADVVKGAFTGNTALRATDFEAAPTRAAAVSLPEILTLGWYTGYLGPKARAAINKGGLTQFRLRFTRDDDDDAVADYLSIFSGNAPAARRPVLEIRYETP